MYVYMYVCMYVCMSVCVSMYLFAYAFCNFVFMMCVCARVQEVSSHIEKLNPDNLRSPQVYQ